MGITINGSSAAGNIDLGTNGTITDLAVGGLPDGSVDADSMASIPATKLTGTIADARFPATLPAVSGASLTGIASPLSFRNYIINGQFQVWQRATTSGSTTSDGYLAADRWRTSASVATYTFSRQAFTVGQTDVPSHPKYFGRFAVTTGDDHVNIHTRIEDIERIQGQVTLSFWAKGSNPAGGNIQINRTQQFGSGGSADVQAEIDTFTVNGTWTKKSFTFTLPSISGKTIGGGSYLGIDFRQPAGDDGSAAWTLDITNVQLELGATATDFEMRSYGDELARCQRYFCKSWNSDVAVGTDSGVGVRGYRNNGTARSDMPCDVWFPVEMRTTPTMTCYNSSSPVAGKVQNGGGTSNFTYWMGLSAKGTYGIGSADNLADGAWYAFHFTSDAEL